MSGKLYNSESRKCAYELSLVPQSTSTVAAGWLVAALVVLIFLFSFGGEKQAEATARAPTCLQVLIEMFLTR